MKKLRISKELHAEMQERAQALGIPVGEVALRCFRHCARIGGRVARFNESESATRKRQAARDSSTVISLPESLDFQQMPAENMRACIEVALEATRTVRPPLAIPAGMVEGRDYIVEKVD